MTVIGFNELPHLPQSYALPLADFLKGLGERGYVDGRNVRSNNARAEGQNERWRRWRPIWFSVRSRNCRPAPGRTAAKAADRYGSDRFESGAAPVQLAFVARA